MGDFHAPKHPELEAISNLQVIKACQSLKSKGMVTEQFAWRHYYWYLTNEGIQYLRDFLHLPPEIVPATLKRATRPEPRPREGGPSDKPRTPRGPPGAGCSRFRVPRWIWSRQARARRITVSPLLTFL